LTALLCTLAEGL